MNLYEVGVTRYENEKMTIMNSFKNDIKKLKISNLKFYSFPVAMTFAAVYGGYIFSLVEPIAVIFTTVVFTAGTVVAVMDAKKEIGKNNEAIRHLKEMRQNLLDSIKEPNIASKNFFVINMPMGITNERQISKTKKKYK